MDIIPSIGCLEDTKKMSHPSGIPMAGESTNNYSKDSYFDRIPLEVQIAALGGVKCPRRVHNNR